MDSAGGNTDEELKELSRRDNERLRKAIEDEIRDTLGPDEQVDVDGLVTPVHLEVYDEPEDMLLGGKLTSKPVPQGGKGSFMYVKKDPAKDSLRVSRAPSEESDPDGQQQKQLSKKERKAKKLKDKNKTTSVPEKIQAKNEDLDDSYDGRKGLHVREEKSAKKKNLK